MIALSKPNRMPSRMCLSAGDRGPTGGRSAAILVVCCLCMLLAHCVPTTVVQDSSSSAACNRFDVYERTSSGPWAGFRFVVLGCNELYMPRRPLSEHHDVLRGIGGRTPARTWCSLQYVVRANGTLQVPGWDGSPWASYRLIRVRPDLLRLVHSSESGNDQEYLRCSSSYSCGVDASLVLTGRPCPSPRGEVRTGISGQ